jgi:hypothetical protein
MDNITPLVHGIPSRCIVTLDPFQQAHYENHCVEIHSPEGIHLETISQELQRENQLHQDIQVRDLIALVESLLMHIDKDVDLPREAVSGLADLMVRMHLVFERVFK